MSRAHPDGKTDKLDESLPAAVVRRLEARCVVTSCGERLTWR